MDIFTEYEVPACANVPPGLPRQQLAVLSPIWQGEFLLLSYPDETIHILRGWSGSGEGEPCGLRVFWTRHLPEDPAVCLAIGGDQGLRCLDLEEADAAPQGYAFLALAESMIPPEVLAVIGQPPPERREILLLA